MCSANLPESMLSSDIVDPLFQMAQGTLPRQPILGSKLAKSDYSPIFVAPAFRNRLQYRHSDFKSFIFDDLAMMYVNLVKFGPVTLEFTKVEYSFFKITLPDKLSQNPPNRFSSNFHRMIDI